MLITGKTNVGIFRDNNEDNFAACTYRMDGIHGTTHIVLGMVSDGMGGEQAGDVASQIAVDIVPGEIFRGLLALTETANPVAAITALIKQSVEKAHLAILAKGEANESMRDMGATCTLALYYGGILYFGNIGDSRGYLWRNQELKQQTQDHSWVGEMVRAGVLTDAQARRHPERNVITRALGVADNFGVDVFPSPPVRAISCCYAVMVSGRWSMMTTCSMSSCCRRCRRSRGRGWTI